MAGPISSFSPSQDPCPHAPCPPKTFQGTHKRARPNVGGSLQPALFMGDSGIPLKKLIPIYITIFHKQAAAQTDPNVPKDKSKAPRSGDPAAPRGLHAAAARGPARHIRSGRGPCWTPTSSLQKANVQLGNAKQAAHNFCASSTSWVWSQKGTWLSSMCSLREATGVNLADEELAQLMPGLTALSLYPFCFAWGFKQHLSDSF